MGRVFFLTLSLLANNSVVLSLISPGFNNCLNFFHLQIPPRNLRGGTEYLCQQQAKGVNDFVFATLYDTIERMPIYSAYILDLNVIRGQPRSRWHADYNQLGPLEQALYGDLTGSGYDRGHLCPSSYYNLPARIATFTMTNAVPQVRTFNQGSWERIELIARNYMENYCNGIP